MDSLIVFVYEHYHIKEVKQNMDKDTFKQMVFDLMCGSLDLESFPVAESRQVENEFKDGRFCSQAYSEIYNANQRLCDRLGTEEDKDVECIISNFFDIVHHLGMKMYDYGELYAGREFPAADTEINDKP